jgi:pimeloyl-ACP methyl ester carboxylesterase
LAGVGVLGAGELAGRLSGGTLSGGLSSAVLGWATSTATRGLAPYSDELFAGAGSGVALAQPGLAQGRAGVAGGAGALAHVARELPVLGNDDPGLRVTRLAPEDFAGGSVPAWSGTGPASVQDALARVDSLYPATGGAPPGTIAVQKLTGPDGAVSWTVLVPGTQSALPADHPWDGRTDLELMAGQADGATAAIERALVDSGVAPDQPVTLVGHSLGGIAATVLVARTGFAERYRVGGLVTAGSPTGLVVTPPGIPVLHLETPEELVSHTDGRSGAENARTRDRVTVVRTLRESTSASDRAASGDVVRAHSVDTHVRTLDLALASGDGRVAEVTERIGARLAGSTASTTFYRAERLDP